LLFSLSVFEVQYVLCSVYVLIVGLTGALQICYWWRAVGWSWLSWPKTALQTTSSWRFPLLNFGLKWRKPLKFAVDCGFLV